MPLCMRRSYRSKPNYGSNTTPTSSWASIAVSERPTAPNRNLPQSANSQKEPNCIRITAPLNPTDTDAADSFTRYLPTNAACNRIKDALQKDNATKNVRVAGIGTTRTGYLIRFKDEQSAGLEACHSIISDRK